MGLKDSINMINSYTCAVYKAHDATQNNHPEIKLKHEERFIIYVHVSQNPKNEVMQNPF